jgi:hypothetical protein
MDSELLEKLFMAVLLGLGGLADYSSLRAHLQSVKQRREEKEKQGLREKYMHGRSIRRHERAAFVRALYSYYSQSPGLDAISYDLSRDNQRQLQLVRLSQSDLPPSDPGYLGEFSAGELELDRPEEIAADRVAEWLELGIKVWDRPTYSLSGFSGDGRPGFRLTQFVTYRSTFGALEDEVLVALGETGCVRAAFEAAAAPRRLGRRFTFMPNAESLLDTRSRLCIGGPLVLFAVLGQQELQFLVQRRSPDVSDEAGQLTVVPKAVHQPEVDPKLESDLEATIWREVHEELMGGEEPSSRLRPIVPDWYLAACPLLDELINGKKFTLKPLGFVLDLVRGNFHAGYVLLIRDQQWFDRAKRDMRMNWEFSGHESPLNRFPGRDLNALIYAEDWAPEAYWTFIEGLRWIARTEGLKDLERQLPALRLRSTVQFSNEFA